MPFRDHQQQNRAIRAMLAPAGLDRHWPDGPDEHARTYVQSCARTGDGVLLRAALALASEGDGPALNEVLRLSTANRERVLSLALAWGRGPDAVDAWLVEHEAQEDLGND